MADPPPSPPPPPPPLPPGGALRPRALLRCSSLVRRIDSPGGGVGPSQEIYEEVKKARAKKPVLASMGALAASGGYYIACAAQRVYANPGTITGSIGVIMPFMSVK